MEFQFLVFIRDQIPLASGIYAFLTQVIDKEQQEKSISSTRSINQFNKKDKLFSTWFPYKNHSVNNKITLLSCEYTEERMKLFK